MSSRNTSTTSSYNSSYDSRRFQPIVYTDLFTSNRANHQATKRIKGLLGYSEYYNGNQNKFHSLRKLLPLKRRDYRKARELSLNLWHPEGQMAFLEKFLKVQTNLKKIQINVMKTKSQREKIVGKLCKVFGKLSRINTVQVVFYCSRETIDFKKARFLMRKLPKLKDMCILPDNQELSDGLSSVGFENLPNKPLISVKDSSTIESLIKRNRKFHELDTIQVNTTRVSEGFWDAIGLVISKLPNFQELNLCYSKNSRLPLKPTLKVLDELLSTPKLQVIRIGLEVDGIERASILKHPIFKAQSFKRVHISLEFGAEITPENLRDIMDCLQKIPNLYQLSLDFNYYGKMNDEAVKGVMKKISEMINLRKLRIIFSQYAPVNISARQVGSLIRSIFKMSLLEELDLRLPRSGLDLTGHNEGKSLGEDIEGLPRLKRMRLIFQKYEEPAGNGITGLLKLIGRCYLLRDLEVEIHPDSVDLERFPKRFKGYMEKLKGLQTLTLDISSVAVPMELETLYVWLEDVFPNLPSLQKVYLRGGVLVQSVQSESDEISVLIAFRQNEEQQKVILGMHFVED